MSHLKPSVSPNDHTRGAANPQIQIVEYGDFQCPYCGLAEPVVEKILRDFGSTVSLTFRNFPLTDMHPWAFAAACSAEAAGKQGKYWEMHDLIFANQGKLSDSFFLANAQKLGLNVSQFIDDANGNDVQGRINTDFEHGAQSGVNGTPTFFINGERFNGGADELYIMIRDHASINQ